MKKDHFAIIGLCLIVLALLCGVAVPRSWQAVPPSEDSFKAGDHVRHIQSGKTGIVTNPHPYQWSSTPHTEVSWDKWPMRMWDEPTILLEKIEEPEKSFDPRHMPR